MVWRVVTGEGLVGGKASEQGDDARGGLAGDAFEVSFARAGAGVREDVAGDGGHAGGARGEVALFDGLFGDGIAL